MTAQALRILVVGAGNRGRAYTRALVQLDYVKICGVADPNKVRRGKLIEICNNDSSIVPYDDWQSAVNDADNYDGVLICVLDDLHREVAVAFAAKGKHMLCEKPLATSWSDCKDICDAVVQNNLLLACGHVLRYSPHNLEMKKLLDQGVVGDIININHTEPVGWYHFAHSYVRGNWKRKDTTTFSLMAKCCHDIDLLMWLLGSDNIRKVSSFGSLSYFRKDRKPAEAGDATRCLSCQNEPSCAYSAKKIYLDEFKKTGSSL
jgi:predicted dehydrogenase